MERGDDIMKVIRYSIHGFTSQKQTHHMKDVNYHLCEFDINDYPDFAKFTIEEIHQKRVDFYLQHLTDLQFGIWCFKDGYKDNQSLNHLKRRVPCWEAELPDNTECYDCNWKRFTNISDPYVLFGGFYIPERELCKLKNIRKRIS